MRKSQKAEIKNRPWNQGKAVGQMSPFTPDQAELIRALLRAEQSSVRAEAAATTSSQVRKLQRRAFAARRDLALFDTAIDTMLRASDLLALRVGDVIDHQGEIVAELSIRQKKTGQAHRATLLDHTRASLERWIEVAGKEASDPLFTSVGNRNAGGALSREQYANLVKKWAGYARLDPRRFSTHSMRRTKSAAVYDQTHNLAACRQLLGHQGIGSTARYLGVDQREALNLARKIRV